MDRQAMLKVVEQGYKARVDGDLEGVLRHFTPDASLRINAEQTQPQLAYVAENADALRDAMGSLIDTFTFSDMQIIDSIVEGSKAVVRLSFTIHAKPTGKSCTTEVLDIFEFKDGKIASLTQFCDTAAAAKLLVK